MMIHSFYLSTTRDSIDSAMTDLLHAYFALPVKPLNNSEIRFKPQKADQDERGKIITLEKDADFRHKSIPSNIDDQSIYTIQI